MKKTCTKCNVAKPITEFTRDRTKSDGYYPSCKTCKHKQERDSMTPERREKRRLYCLEYARAHSREAVKRAAGYVKNNRAHVAEYQKTYQQKHKERLRIYNRERQRKKYQEDGSAAKARWHRRRARKISNGGTYTSEQWHKMREWFGNICLACGESKPLTVDHVIPLSLGGTNGIENIQPICLSCNCSKQDKIIDYRDKDKLSTFLNSLE